jgi:hypothetical protein
MPIRESRSIVLLRKKFPYLKYPNRPKFSNKLKDRYLFFDFSVRALKIFLATSQSQAVEMPSKITKLGFQAE